MTPTYRMLFHRERAAAIVEQLRISGRGGVRHGRSHVMCEITPSPNAVVTVEAVKQQDALATIQNLLEIAYPSKEREIRQLRIFMDNMAAARVIGNQGKNIKMLRKQIHPCELAVFPN